MKRTTAVLLTLLMALTLHAERSEAVDTFAGICETNGYLMAVLRSGIVWRGTTPECEWTQCGFIPATSGEFIAMESGDQDRHTIVALTHTGEIWTCSDCQTDCGIQWQFCGQMLDPQGGDFVGLCTIDPFEQRLAAITDSGTVIVGLLCAPSEMCRGEDPSAVSGSTWGQVKSSVHR